MAIIKTGGFRAFVHEVDFVREVELFGSQKNFSHYGVRALIDYLEDYSESFGEDVNIDVIGLCCDYSEAPWQEIAAKYSIVLYMDDPDKISTVREYLENKTTVVGENDGVFVYATF